MADRWLPKQSKRIYTIEFLASRIKYHIQVKRDEDHAFGGGDYLVVFGSLESA